MFRLTAVFVAAVTLGACAQAPDTIFASSSGPEAFAVTPGASTHRIMIATSRAPASDPALMFSGERSPGVNFAVADVSVPPNHEVGQIERPKRLPGDPSKEFVVKQSQRLSGGDAFRDQVQAMLDQRPEGKKNILVFVHGYNTGFGDAVLRLTQFVHDTGFKGVPVLFSWASRGKLRDYVYDLNSALTARDAFTKTGDLLSATNAEGFDVISHSMGNMLVVEAMRQLALSGVDFEKTRLRNVVLASPDIDMDLFETQMRLMPKNNRKSHVFVMLSRDDKALLASRRLAGGVERLGATDSERLAELGITVVDLTEVEAGRGLNHSKFADSPAVVQLFGRHMRLTDQERQEIEADPSNNPLDRVARSVGIVVTEGAELVTDGVEAVVGADASSN